MVRYETVKRNRYERCPLTYVARPFSKLLARNAGYKFMRCGILKMAKSRVLYLELHFTRISKTYQIYAYRQEVNQVIGINVTNALLFNFTDTIRYISSKVVTESLHCLFRYNYIFCTVMMIHFRNVEGFVKESKFIQNK